MRVLKPRDADVLLEWVDAAGAAERTTLSQLESALTSARLEAASIKPSARALRYTRLLDDEPRLLDWALALCVCPTHILALRTTTLRRRPHGLSYACSPFPGPPSSHSPHRHHVDL